MQLELFIWWPYNDVEIEINAKTMLGNLFHVMMPS